jgi:hypothetical protein
MIASLPAKHTVLVHARGRSGRRWERAADRSLAAALQCSEETVYRMAARGIPRHVDESERGVEVVDRRITRREFEPEWQAATRTAVKPRS